MNIQVSLEKEIAAEIAGSFASGSKKTAASSSSAASADFEQQIKDLIGQINLLQLGQLTGHEEVEDRVGERVLVSDVAYLYSEENYGTNIVGADASRVSMEENFWTNATFDRVVYLTRDNDVGGHNSFDWLHWGEIDDQAYGSDYVDVLQGGVEIDEAFNYSFIVDDARWTENEILEGSDVNFTAYQFAGAELQVEEVSNLSVSLYDADKAEISLDEVSGGKVLGSGDNVQVDANSVELDSFRLLGDDNELYAHHVQIQNLQIGDDGYAHLHYGFAKGRIGEGVEVDLRDFRAVLTLEGGNEIDQSGGQSLFDAQNGKVDHFEFTDGAKADGEFDAFDLISLGGTTTWTAGELFASDEADELTFFDLAGVELAGTVPVEHYDDFLKG